MKSIVTKELTKKFGDFTAVNHISFEVSKGEIFGFLGANGAGKTTAIKMLCGLLSPTSGEGKVAGYDIYKDADKIKKNIGYMSQKFSLYEDLTIKENMRVFGGIYGMSSKDIKLKTEVSLRELTLEAERDTLVKSLPLGIKQKVSFAVSTFHSPEIVFLDEPTGGVDPIARRTFWEMIYQASTNGITIFVTTHYMDEAEYCNRVSIMVNSKIVALDTPSGLRQKYQVDTMDEVFQLLARGAKRE
ncbi:ABC transporter ATP-binding protein [Apibacter sp.]|uniref:ABC transporter ATP-binding protein n=1 Tax=Apibacter sp. TaxID=2023709 RepID=UPI0025D4C86F|nr:ABC transporter ATP-binding protein [Apibacter sp.]MCT6868511.1 ABC transporter ATP-binding protein [Apibacter sp.]